MKVTARQRSDHQVGHEIVHHDWLSSTLEKEGIYQLKIVVSQKSFILISGSMKIYNEIKIISKSLILDASKEDEIVSAGIWNTRTYSRYSKGNKISSQKYEGDSDENFFGLHFCIQISKKRTSMTKTTFHKNFR